MEKREQRARRDRRRDGKRNTFQKEQEKETVTQTGSFADKTNGAQKSEVTTDKNTHKDKVVEDDPLRFANLKRETDEIAALKAIKPQKRQVFSNWSKYEEPLPSLNESQAVDFESLLHAPQSGSFRFKSEKQWDAASFGQYGELFTPDVELLVAGLTALPFYTRLGIDKTLFLEEEIEKIDNCAKANAVAYDNLSKSKPKPKKAVTDLFRVNEADQYSVVDQVNGSVSDLSRSKPVFSVEQSPEPLSPSCTDPQPTEGTSAAAAVQDFKFGKLPSHPGADSARSPAVSREATPAPELHFERAPPPSCAPGNLRSPLTSRESTPAKETVSAEAAPEISFGRPPPAASDVQYASREGTPSSVRETRREQKATDDYPAVTRCTPPPVPLSENSVSLKAGTPDREDLSRGPSVHKDSPVRERTPVQLLEGEPPSAAVLVPEVAAQPCSQVPPEDDITEEDVHIKQEQRYHSERALISENNPEENDRDSDGYSKRKGKQETRKQNNQQRGGGRQGRRKKGQQTAAADGETRAGESAESLPAEAPVVEKAVQEVKRKPERPPPPAGVQQERPPPPAVVQQERPPSPAVAQKGRSPPPAAPSDVPQAGDTPTPPAAPAQPPPQRKVAGTAKPVADDDGLSFLMSLKGQKAGGVSEVAAVKSTAKAAASRSAIEEDELKELQKPKAPPVIAAEKKEDLEDWLDSMLDD